MNRRKFLSCLSSLPAASLAVPTVFSLEPNQESGNLIERASNERCERNARSPSDRELRVAPHLPSATRLWFAGVGQPRLFSGPTIEFELTSIREGDAT